jgi:hypothetical protein
MQIEIDIEVLKSVSSMKEDKARQIIDQTKKVMNDWRTPIDVTPVNQRITMEAPTDLGDGPLVIVLMNKDAETMAELGYDQERKKFPPREEEGEIVAELGYDQERKKSPQQKKR